MNKLLSLLLTAFFCGCYVANADYSEPAQENVSVELPITAAHIEQITRTTDQYAIADVNLYMVGENNGIIRHLYSTASTLRLECPAGVYTIYAIANMHEDMGELPAFQSETMTLPHQDALSDLPMTACTEVEIRAAEGNSPVVLPAIEVRRRVAKIAYRISVDPVVSDIRLQSVQAFSLPCRTSLFGEIHPSTVASGYTVGPRIDIAPSSASVFSGEHYQLANPQGCVAGIVSQREKDAAHAPTFASYLLIRARRGQEVLAYRVYLGENNTDNFDILPNTSHTLDITIRGDNQTDTRISSYIVHVWDDIEEESYDGHCVYDIQRTLRIAIDGKRNDIPLHAEIRVNRGSGNDLLLNRDIIAEQREIELQTADGINQYEIEYSPVLFDRMNYILGYAVIIRDEGGFEQLFHFEHSYANTLYVKMHDGAAANAHRGKIAVGNALYIHSTGTANSERFVLTDADGCTQIATPNAGYRFAGWYGDPKHTKLLSSLARYAYKPKRTRVTVFARFEIN